MPRWRVHDDLRKRVIPLFVAIIVPIAVVLVVIATFQSQLLFPTHAVGPPGPLPASAEKVSLTTPDGDTLHGIHIPPASAPAKARTLIIGFGGNAWNGANVAAYLHQLYPDADVVTFHYRGYRPSTGSASATALLADAPLIYDRATELVKPDRIAIVGFSIGSGVAAGLVRSRKVDGLILVTPFDSLKAAAADLYPWLPIAMFFEHEMDAAGLLAGSDVPVAILGAEHDSLIVPARTDALRRRVGNLIYDRTIAGAGHNDIYQRPEFGAAM